MTSPKGQTRLSKGDVALFSKPHLDEASPESSEASEKMVVPVKTRPMLIYSDTDFYRHYGVLGFTSKRPPEAARGDFFLDSNSQPKYFGPKFGLRMPCFLNIAQIHSYPSSLFRRTVGTMPRAIFDAILEACA